jgi:hypothetical protein
VKIRTRSGKAVILALFSASLSACGNGPILGGNHQDASSLQSTVSDPQVRVFYEARQWKTAWDKKATNQLLDIIASAPTNGLKPDLFLKQPLPKDASARESSTGRSARRTFGISSKQRRSALTRSRRASRSSPEKATRACPLSRRR